MFIWLPLLALGYAIVAGSVVRRWLRTRRFEIFLKTQPSEEQVRQWLDEAGVSLLNGEKSERSAPEARPLGATLVFGSLFALGLGVFSSVLPSAFTGRLILLPVAALAASVLLGKMSLAVLPSGEGPEDRVRASGYGPCVTIKTEWEHEAFRAESQAAEQKKAADAAASERERAAKEFERNFTGLAARVRTPIFDGRLSSAIRIVSSRAGKVLPEKSAGGP